MFNFKNAGHMVAIFLQKVVADLPKVSADLEKVEGSATVVEGVSAVAAPAAVPVEDAAYAALGGLIVALNAGGAAAEQKLTDAGLDIGAINAAKAVIPQTSQVLALAKKLF